MNRKNIDSFWVADLTRRQFLKYKLFGIASLVFSCGTDMSITKGSNGKKVVLRWKTVGGQEFEKSYSRD